MNISSDTPLAHVVSRLGSSLSMYISDAGIWTYPGAEEVKLALADLVDDQRSLVERASVLLEERGLEIPRHPYPIRFTATHDLDLRALLPRVVAELRSHLVALEKTSAPQDDPDTADLIGEAVTSTRAHLDALQELLARPRRPAG